MKIEIGPYTNWFGPHQLAEKICFWAKKTIVDEYGSTDYPDYVFKLGEWLAYGKWRGVDDIPTTKRNLFAIKEEKETLLYEFLLWLDQKRRRKIKVQIDKYDTWSMDTTLAKIVYPMLVQLKATKHGYPMCMDMEDVPENLRLVDTRNSYDWHYGQESLFDYEECNPEHISIDEARWDWILDEMIYAFGILNDDDKVWIAGDNGPDDNNRVNNGLRLFGKYYRALWD